MSPGRAGGRRGSGAGLAATVVCALALASSSGPVTAQGPSARAVAPGVVAGRVVRPGAADTAAVSGVRIVLHRVGSDVQGPIDSMVSGAGGRYRFRFSADTGTVYLLSARYRGIEYFSQPVPGAAAQAGADLDLPVFDTSSTAPVGLAARHVIIPRPGEDGGREVLELIVLRNAGHLARVAPDSVSDSWSLPLPPGSEGLEVGDSDVSSEAVTRRGDSLHLVATIGPGEKQLTLTYHLPPGMSDLAVPVGAAAGTMNVLVEEAGASVTGPGLAPADTQVVLGRTFRRWTGEVPAGGLLRVRLPAPPRNPGRLLALLVGGLALALGLAAWRLRRGPRHPPAPSAAGPPPPGPPSDGALLHRLARLDADYAGREAEVPAEEWTGYLAERARLKAQLEAALAADRARR